MMSTRTLTEYEKFLDSQDEQAWARALDELLPAAHEVDRNATRVWFAFFPLSLARALETADDPERLAQRLLLQGSYRLADQIDSSHAFLYGHRFWREVKDAATGRAASPVAAASSLADEVRAVARRAAESAKVSESLTLGISAVALMTIGQVGLAAFEASPGASEVAPKSAKKSPDAVVSERARDDSQGLLGFLRTTDKQWTVTWDEHDPTARFKATHSQEIASASPNDTRDWSQIDPRCTVNEGPIPVQCRSASCGTCWVGVLGGAEKLSPVAERERRVMQLLGYVDTDEPQPLIRLSCQAQTGGAVSLRIPPWNGVFGRYVRDRRAGVGDSEAGGAVGGTAGE